MHKGKLDFDIYDDPNSPFSKVLVSLWTVDKFVIHILP